MPCLDGHYGWDGRDMRKGAGKNKSHSVNCEGCQWSEAFLHSHLSSSVADPCFEMTQLSEDILSCNCRFPFSVLVLSHSALDNQLKILPQAMCKMPLQS